MGLRSLAAQSLVLSAVTCGLAAGAVLGSAEVLIVGAGVAFLWILVVVDLDLLPAIALASFALVPAAYLPHTHDGAYNPALVVVVILFARVIWSNHPIALGPHLVPLALLLTWILAATLASSVPTTSLAWSGDCVLLLGIPAL